MADDLCFFGKCDYKRYGFRGRDMDLEARISALSWDFGLRAGFGPQGWDLGLMAEIWA